MSIYKAGKCRGSSGNRLVYFYKAFVISILHHQAIAYKLTWRSIAEALLKKKADIRKSSKWILSS